MNSVTQTSPPMRARHAALIDVENLLIHHTRALGHAESALVLNRVQSLIGGVPTRTAVGHALLRSQMPAITALGGGLTLTPSNKDAADRALLEAGRAFVAHGVTDLFIASGDNVFAELTSIARLHVIAYPSKLSRRLRLAATTISLLNYTPHNAHEGVLTVTKRAAY